MFHSLFSLWALFWAPQDFTFAVAETVVIYNITLPFLLLPVNMYAVGTYYRATSGGANEEEESNPPA